MQRAEIHDRRKTMKTILATLGISAFLALVVGLLVIYSGIFNVAATVSDAAILRSVLVNTREASIGRRARDIEVPAPGGPGQVERGFRLYREMCVMCHTPVGRTPTPMAIGLNPQAPGFAENDMSAAELFWATKHGIRFTGMSAWGPSRSDQELWDMIAFIQVLPKMSAADYDALDRRIPTRPGPQK